MQQEDPKMTDEKTAFLSYGVEDTDLDYGYEYAIVGNEEGFRCLRDKIDELLESGDEVEMPLLADEGMDT